MKSLHNYFQELCKEAGRSYKTFNIDTKKIDSATWENIGFNSDHIRYGHIEYFKSNNGKVEVVHTMCYPHFNFSLPIFGFDVIALNGNVTGIFCDVTPAPFDHPELRKKINSIFKEYEELKRTLPEWTEMFSIDFIAVSPKDKFNEIADKCIELYKQYLQTAQTPEMVSPMGIIKHKELQNKYSEYQQQNTKTAKALAAYIGEEEANNFIKTVLFPIVK